MWQRLTKFVSKVNRKGGHHPRTYNTAPVSSCPRHKILFLTFCSGDLASRYHQQHGGCGQRRRAKQVKSNLFNSRWCQIQRQKGKTSFQATICRSTWTRRVSRSVGLELLLGWGRQVKHFSCKSTIKVLGRRWYVQEYRKPRSRPRDHPWAPEQKNSTVHIGHQGITKNV